MTTFEKIKLLEVPDIYTVNAFNFDSGLHIGAGTEKTGSIFLVDFSSGLATVISNGPGGMMSLVPVPDRPDMLLSVMGLFPPFKGLEAGIYTYSRINNRWTVERTIHLPFAHRCEILNVGGVNYLFSSTVSKYKADPSDWSLPGQVYITELSNQDASQWKTESIINNLYRNHGMLKVSINGKDTICVSGQEGIFALYPDKRKIQIDPLFDKEVSEFAFIDIDGDNCEELVTIEPFHGNSLNIYSKKNTVWEKIYDSELSFGHGLSAGIIGNIPSIVVGNRRDEASLILFHTQNNKVERITIEEATGTTQTQFFSHGGRDYILAANQLKNEVALYYHKIKQ